MGKITLSSFLHGVLALMFSGISFGLGYMLDSIALAAAFTGIAFFFGREMTSYQKWREKQGNGLDNVFLWPDLNPLNWNKDGRGDGTWDFLVPAIVCLLAAALIELI